MNTYNRGSEWRKWDLHIHTKGTNKNDQFSSGNMEIFLKEFFKKAILENISVIGVTDYFSIDRYKDVIEYQNSIESKKDINGNNIFTNNEIEFIKNIFILPNVELRMLPATDRGRLINIHFIFNPDYVEKLDNDFFAELKNHAGYKMNKQGIMDYGRTIKPSITDDNIAYREGIEKFALDITTIKNLLDKNTLLKYNRQNKTSNFSKQNIQKK